MTLQWVSIVLWYLVGGWCIARYWFEDLCSDVTMLGKFSLDVVAGLSAVLAGVGSTCEAAGIHDGGRPGCPPRVVLRGKHRVLHLVDLQIISVSILLQCKHLIHPKLISTHLLFHCLQKVVLDHMDHPVPRFYSPTPSKGKYLVNVIF